MLKNKSHMIYFALAFIMFNQIFAQDTITVIPGSELLSKNLLKPNRIEFDELLYRDTDSIIQENRFYIQLTYGMKNSRPVYYMFYMGVSSTNSGFDILHFDRETLAMQHRVLEIGDDTAVLNFSADSIYGHYPNSKSQFSLKIDNTDLEEGFGFDLNMNPYMYASLDLKLGMIFKWPAFSITTGKSRWFVSEVIDYKLLTNKYGRSFWVYDVVHRKDWNGKKLAVHHYVSKEFPYYIGRDWWIEPQDKKPYLWHRWQINDFELLNTTLEEEIYNWNKKN